MQTNDFFSWISTDTIPCHFSLCLTTSLLGSSWMRPSGTMGLHWTSRPTETERHLLKIFLPPLLPQHLLSQNHQHLHSLSVRSQQRYIVIKLPYGMYMKINDMHIILLQDFSNGYEFVVMTYCNTSKITSKIMIEVKQISCLDYLIQIKITRGFSGTPTYPIFKALRLGLC